MLMAPVRVLTNTEYSNIYKQLNSNETMTKYKENGVFLLYCDNVIIKTAKELEKLRNSHAEHYYKFEFLPLGMFRLIESNEGLTLCRTEELKDYIKLC
jgi:hypothetical protein